MKILLAADGSPFTKRAAKYLVEYVAMLKGTPEITVVNVHPMIPYPGAAGVVGKDAIEKYYRDECRKALSVASHILDKAGLAHEALWVVGDVAAEIGILARKRRADLIIMGSHGNGALAGLVLGSVTTKVLATTRVPVLIVR